MNFKDAVKVEDKRHNFSLGLYTRNSEEYFGTYNLQLAIRIQIRKGYGIKIGLSFAF